MIPEVFNPEAARSWYNQHFGELMGTDELRKDLEEMFLKHNLVIQGYDTSIWTREEHEEAVRKHGWKESFEELAARAAKELA